MMTYHSSDAGKALRTAMAIRSVNNLELAKVLGVNAEQVSRLRRQKDMKWSRVQMLVDHFDLTLEEFQRLGQ